MADHHADGYFSLLDNGKLEYEDLLEIDNHLNPNKCPKGVHWDLEHYPERTTRPRSRRSGYHRGNGDTGERESLAREQAQRPQTELMAGDLTTVIEARAYTKQLEQPR